VLFEQIAARLQQKMKGFQFSIPESLDIAWWS